MPGKEGRVLRALFPAPDWEGFLLGFAKIECDFPAVLKTEEDKVLEYGTACANIQEGRIDFKNEFVPLFKMGTRLKIVRVHDGVETHSFTGEVYLSAEKLLRLVSVRDEVLPGAATAYLYDVKMEGTASAMLAPKRKLFRPEGLPSLQVFPVSVYALSMSQLRFTCTVTLPQGQRLTVNVPQPPLFEQLPIQVELPVDFGEGATGSYRCKILDLPGENRYRLERFLQSMSLRVNKSFPPLPDNVTAF